MADALLAQIQDIAEGQVDFKGQKTTETLTTTGLAVTGLVAFLVGYIQEDIHLTLWVGLAGALSVAFIVVPPWPMYNQRPEAWLRSGSEIAGQGIEVDGKKIN